MQQLLLGEREAKIADMASCYLLGSKGLGIPGREVTLQRLANSLPLPKPCD